MADDHDTLLAEVDIRAPGDTGNWSGNYKLTLSDPALARALAAALRDLKADYHAALDNLAMVIEGFEPAPTGTHWHRDPILADDNERTIEEMTDREWRVFCHAAQRATQNVTADAERRTPN
jgi:hypothetical protein